MNESKATRYQRMHRRVRTASWIMAGSALALVAFTPVGRWLYAQSEALVASLPTAVRRDAGLVVFVTLVTGICEFALLPIEYIRLRRADAIVGRHDPGTLSGRLLGTAALLPVVVAGGVVVVWSGRLAGGGWWVMAALLLALGLAAAVRIGPAILGRLADVRALARPALVARLDGLARRCRVPLAAIQEWRVGEESSTVAMMAGIGRGRRVLLATDVARNWSDDEVEVVVAHELAHHVHRDLLQALVLNTLVIGAGLLGSDLVLARLGRWLGLAGASDPVALPVIAFVTLVVWLAATPVRHAQSRRHERRADRFALAVTGQADAFVAAVRRAGTRHLIDDRPTTAVRWLFHRHPSVAQRVELAESWRRQNDRTGGAESADPRGGPAGERPTAARAARSIGTKSTRAARRAGR